MKNKLLTNWPILIFALLILASIFDVFYSSAIQFEDKAAKEILLSRTILTEIETLSIPIVEDIPFLKSWGQTYQTNFDKILSYLDIAGGLILIQMTLLKLSHWWIFKALLLISFAGLFLKQTKNIAKKLLIVGLLISPGLAIYTQFLSGVTQELSLDLGKDLSEHLTATKDSINAQSLKQKSKLDSLQEVQKAKHGGKLNILDKLEDEAIKIEGEVKTELEKIGKEFLDILRYASQHGLEIAVSLLGNIAVIFLLLPLAYAYLLGLALQRLFNYSNLINRDEKLLEELKSILPKSKTGSS